MNYSAGLLWWREGRLIKIIWRTSPVHPDSVSSFLSIYPKIPCWFGSQGNTIITVLGGTWSLRTTPYLGLWNISPPPTYTSISKSLKRNTVELKHINTQSVLCHHRKKKIKDFIYPPFTVRPSIVFFANTPNSSAFPVAGFCKARVMRNVTIHSIILICKARGLS